MYLLSDILVYELICELWYTFSHEDKNSSHPEDSSSSDSSDDSEPPVWENVSHMLEIILSHESIKEELFTL